MKKILFLFSIICFSSLLFAQAPQGINYQGVVRDNAGSALSNTVIAVQFQIHSGAFNGPIIFSETHSSVPTDTFGLYTWVIGSANPSQFSAINWASGKKFKHKQLQDLLFSITNEPMETQKQKLNDVFDNWKGNLEQVNDVCLIGVRV